MQTRLGVAIGVPLGVILLVVLIAFMMICPRKRRRNHYFHALPTSQDVQQPPTLQEGIFISPIPATDPTVPSVPSSPGVAPPPYRSPDPTSSY